MEKNLANDTPEDMVDPVGEVLGIFIGRGLWPQQVETPPSEGNSEAEQAQEAS